MVKTISSEHKKVIDFFTSNNDVFPYKGHTGSLKHAFTKIADAIDALLLSEFPKTQQGNENCLDFNANIGETMFMLLASIGIDENSTSFVLNNIRRYLGRNDGGEIELSGTNSDECIQGIDIAISRAAENIAAAIRENPENLEFAMKLANAIGAFNWNNDRLDITLEIFQKICSNKRKNMHLLENQ